MLPAGRHFAITWSIPDSYGGMTTAMLQRSRAFVRLGGATVDVLTFDVRADYPSVEADLRARGDLVDGMRLLNLYDWLRDSPLPGGTLRPELHRFTPLEPDHPGPVRERGGVVLSRSRLATDGSILQVDHFRTDGSLLLSDRRDVLHRGDLGGRSVVLCDPDGRPVRSWGGIHPLYRAWLDRLTARRPSWMIVDSKTSANFMTGYRRPHVTVVHVVHNSHLARADEPLGAVRASRSRVFDDLRAFDSVVVLTRRQRHDVVTAHGHADIVRVIPNASDHADDHGGRQARDPRRGVVLASLTSRKRVDHAVRAVIAAHESTGVTLDVFGDGELRAELERLAAGHPGIVTFHGHRTDARRALAGASFLLATGSSEGFPLVLVEAMAAGCIPISYDVPYGASDIIDARNGLLVPSGDAAALEHAIVALATEPEHRLAARRRTARRTAERYGDRAVTALWSRELRAASRRHARSLGAPTAQVGATAVRQAS